MTRALLLQKKVFENLLRPTLSVVTNRSTGFATSNPRSLQQEIDENFASFMHDPPTLLPTQRGRFALLHDRQITGIYDTIRDAQMAASSLYGEGLYSIQQVTDAAGDLGFFSHAVHLGSP